MVGISSETGYPNPQPLHCQHLQRSARRLTAGRERAIHSTGEGCVMSLAALSSNSIPGWSVGTYQNPFQLIKQDFEQLAGALQSGDLSQAQTAYSNIQELLEANSGYANGNAGAAGHNTLETELGTLGQALESGTQTSQNSANGTSPPVQRHHHHHHHHGGGSSSTSSSGATSTNGSSATAANSTTLVNTGIDVYA